MMFAGLCYMFGESGFYDAVWRKKFFAYNPLKINCRGH
jgi:hypothetical protein